MGDDSRGSRGPPAYFMYSTFMYCLLGDWNYQAAGIEDRIWDYWAKLGCMASLPQPCGPTPSLGSIRYYLEETGGDMKAAVLLARTDDSWEYASGQQGSQRGFQRYFFQRMTTRT